jgi:hypothetical protein
VDNGIVVMEDTLAAFGSDPPPNYSSAPVKIGYIITSGPSQSNLQLGLDSAQRWCASA